jgi:hypothetical protein
MKIYTNNPSKQIEINPPNRLVTSDSPFARKIEEAGNKSYLDIFFKRDFNIEAIIIWTKCRISNEILLNNNF